MMFLFLIIAGAVCALVAQTMIVIRGFRVHLLWGIGLIFLWPIWIAFLFLHWEESKGPLKLWLAAIGLCVVGIILIPTSSEPELVAEQSAHAASSSGSYDAFNRSGFRPTETPQPTISIDQLQRKLSGLRSTPAAMQLPRAKATATPIVVRLADTSDRALEHLVGRRVLITYHNRRTAVVTLVTYDATTLDVLRKMGTGEMRFPIQREHVASITEAR